MMGHHGFLLTALCALLAVGCGGGDGGGARPSLPLPSPPGPDGGEGTAPDSSAGGDASTGPGIAILTPAPGDCVGDSVLVIVESEHPGFALRLRVGEETYDGFGAGEEPGTLARALPLEALPAGPLTLRVDSGPGTLAAEVPVHRVTAPPLLQVFSPQAGELAVGELYVHATAFDTSPCPPGSIRLDIEPAEGGEPVFSATLEAQAVITTDDGGRVLETELHVDERVLLTTLNSAAYQARISARSAGGLESASVRAIDVVAPLNYEVGLESSHDIAQPRVMAVGDYDGDGLDDVWVAGQGGLAVARARGDGRFTAPVKLRTANIFALGLHDFDGDGQLDAVIIERVGPLYVSTVLRIDGGEVVHDIEAVELGQNEPRRAALRDLDGDGNPEWVWCTNSAERTLGVLKGRSFAAGGAAFSSATTWSGGVVGATDLSFGDFNGDGHLDAVIGSKGSKKVSVFLGTGAGTFLAASDTILVRDPVLVAPIRAPGDPHLGLVTGFDPSGEIRWHRGLGTGYFDIEPGVENLWWWGGGPTRVLTVDLDGDGHDDVLTAWGGSKGVAVLRAAATAQRVSAAYVAGPNPIDVAVGHFTPDPDLDIAVLNGGQLRFTVLPSRGAGTFAAARRLMGPIEQQSADADSLTAPPITSLAVGQFDDQPGLDIAVITDVYRLFGSAAAWRSDVYFYPLRGALPSTLPERLEVSGFWFPPPWALEPEAREGEGERGETGGRTGPAEWPPPDPLRPKGKLVALETGDFDGNGLDDLVMITRDHFGHDIPLNTEILLQVAPGQFEPQPGTWVGRVPGPFEPQQTQNTPAVAVVAARFDADARTDLAVASPWATSPDGAIFARVNSAVAATAGDPPYTTFAPRAPASPIDETASSNPGVSALLALDVNGDAIADIVSVNTSVDSVGFHFGVGDGTFLPARLSASVAPGVAVAAIEQLNPGEDDAPDLVSVGQQSLFVSYGAPGQVGQVDFPFTPPQSWPYPGNKAEAIAAADLNGDGLADLAVADSNRASLILYLNIGNRTFANEVVELHTGPSPKRVLAVDLDEDGCVDLVVRDQAGLTYFRNAACD